MLTLVAFLILLGLVVFIAYLFHLDSEEMARRHASEGHLWRREGCIDVCRYCYKKVPQHDLDGCFCRNCKQVVHDLGPEREEVIGGDWSSSGAGQTWYAYYARCAHCGEEFKMRETTGP